MSENAPTTPGSLKDTVIAALRTVMDPELPVNLYDLGLIYDLEVSPEGVAAIRMTLTTPNCPVAESMPGRVREAVAAVDGVTSVDVELVWEPAWTSERMTPDAALELEMMGIEWSEGGGPTGPRTTGLTIGRSGRKPRDS